LRRPWERGRRRTLEASEASETKRAAAAAAAAAGPAGGTEQVWSEERRRRGGERAEERRRPAWEPASNGRRKRGKETFRSLGCHFEGKLTLLKLRRRESPRTVVLRGRRRMEKGGERQEMTERRGVLAEV